MLAQQAQQRLQHPSAPCRAPPTPPFVGTELNAREYDIMLSLLPMSSLSLAFRPIIPATGLTVHPLMNEQIPQLRDNSQQKRPARSGSSPCGKSLGCAGCTCKLGGRKAPRGGTARMLMQERRDEDDPPVIANWEMSQVLKNRDFLASIRDNEQQALQQLEAFLNEYPPSATGNDAPDDILG